MQTIKLTQESLQHYFSSANITNCHHVMPGYPYDFINNNSDILLVSVGDSWTWGSGINGKHIDIFSEKQQQDLRRQHVWGYKVAKHMNADWLNLAQYGQGNLWMAERINDFRTLCQFLKYKKIYIVCVFTGCGRWFYTYQDQRINYRENFNNKMKSLEEYDIFLKGLNSYCINSILASVGHLDNIDILIGTNSVDSLGFESLSSKQILQEPWYKLLDSTHPSSKKKIYTDIDSIKYLINLEELLSNSEQKYIFKRWMLDIIEKSELRSKIFDNEKIYYDFHPLKESHKVWADYVTEQLL
jgi:hypothetical protein